MTKSFKFTSANLQKVQQDITKYPEGKQASAVLSLLDLAQRQSGGWLPHAAIECVAEMLDMPTMQVLEAASFYTMLNLQPVGKHHVQVCTTTPCWLRGSSEVLMACQRKLKINPGETTEDGQFSLSEVECLGACINAPVVQINDDYHEDLSPAAMEELLDKLKRGK